MKKLLGIIVMMLMVISFFMVTPLLAEEVLKFGPDVSTFKVFFDEESKFLDIEGKNIHLRIYESGKIEKERWIEINPNESNVGLIGIISGTTTWSILTASQETLKNNTDKIKWTFVGGIFSISWNEEKKYLEVKSNKVRFRIEECGRVKQHSWKEIGEQKEKSK